MSEPPLPIVPTGQPRNFDLLLPEQPTFGGPGSLNDPSVAGTSSCAMEVIALADAVEVDPSSANINALNAFIQAQTGQTIAQLLPSVWAAVASDGIQRTGIVTVCGVDVTITVGSTLVLAGDCAALPVYQMTLSQNDFTLSPLTVGTTFVSPTTGAYQDFLQLPEYDVHLDDPELVWLGQTTDAAILAGVRSNTNIIAQQVTVGGETWIPRIRVTGEFSTPAVLFHQHLPADGYEFSTIIPPLGLRVIRRSPSGGSAPTVDDVVRLGTISHPFPSNPYSVINTDYSTMYSTSTDNNFKSDQYLLTTQVQNISIPGGSHRWPQISSGSGHASRESAWTAFAAEVASYNASRTAYQPLVSIDAATESYTVSFQTRNNALYLHTYGCSESGIGEALKYDKVTVVFGGYYHFREGDATTAPSLRGNSLLLSTERTDLVEGVLERVIRADDGECGVAETDYQRVVASEEDTYVPRVVDAEAEGAAATGEPPHTVPNPPITPVGGGCRSYLDGPSSCNWNVPVPAAPQPEVPEPFEPDFPEPPSPGNPKTPTPNFPHIPPTPNFPMPRDRFPGPPSPESPVPPALPEAPVITTDLPNIPSLPCIVPDFGNIDPCGGGNGNGAGRHPGTPGSGGAGAGPGTMGPLPGGRDFMGNRGSAGTIASVKTGGQTYDARTYLFTETYCPGQALPHVGCMAVIVQLLMDAGIAPVDIIFQVGPEWDKEFPADKCFVRGSRIFDAAMWTARFLMLTIVDEGSPTNDVYIGPPWHRPLQTVWTFDEHYDLFNLNRSMSSEEAYGWVEVYGPNVTSPIIVRIDSPFFTEDAPTLRLEVGANFTQEDAEGLGAYKASIMMRQAVSVQATVPYSSDYFLRDLMRIEAPDKGFQETYVITGKESDMSAAGRFHILTGMLPATLAELDTFPTVTDEYDAVEGGFT